ADPQWKPPGSAELWEKRFRSLFEMASSVGLAPHERGPAVRKVLFPPTGTIHGSALNEKGKSPAARLPADWPTNFRDQLATRRLLAQVVIQIRMSAPRARLAAARKI